MNQPGRSVERPGFFCKRQQCRSIQSIQRFARNFQYLPESSVALGVLNLPLLHAFAEFGPQVLHFRLEVFEPGHYLVKLATELFVTSGQSGQGRGDAGGWHGVVADEIGRASKAKTRIYKNGTTLSKPMPREPFTSTCVSCWG